MPHVVTGLVALCVIGELCVPVLADGRGVARDAAGDPLPPGAVARIGVVRWRHTSWIQSVAVSANGQCVIAAGGQYVRVFDAASGKETAAFRFPHSHRLRLSDDGTLLAYSRFAHGAEVVATGTAKRRHVLEGPTASLEGLAFSRDNRFLATTHHDNTVWVWDLDSGKPVLQLAWPRLEGNVGGAPAFSPDGQWLACAAAHGRVYVWEVTTGKKLCTIVPPKGQGFYSNAGFSPDGGLLVTFNNNGCNLDLWDVRAGKHVRALGSEERFDWSYVFTSQNTLAAIEPSRIGLWNVDTGKCVRSIALDRSKMRFVSHDARLALAPDGKTLVVGGSDHTLRVFDIEGGRELQVQQQGMTGAVRAAVAADGKTLVTWDNAWSYNFTRSPRFTFRSWDTQGRPLRQQEWSQGDRYLFALSPHITAAVLVRGQPFDRWRVAAVPSSKGNEEEIEIKQGYELNKAVLDRGGGTVTLRFRESDRFGSGSGNSRVEVWKKGADQRWGEVASAHGDEFCLSPDGRQLLTTERRGKQQFLVTLDLDSKRTTSCPSPLPLAYLETLSPSGRLLVGVTYYREPLLIETAGGQIVARLAKHEHFGYCFAFSPCGKLLACAHPEGAILVCHGLSGEVLGRLEGHRGFLSSLAFTADGQTMVSGSYDTTALIWNMRPWHEKTAPRAARLSAEQLDTLWQRLSFDKTEEGRAAAAALAQMPEQALALLAAKLKPVRREDLQPANAWIAKLSHRQFAVRQQAMTELQKLGRAAESALGHALAEPVPLETKRRVEQLLARLETQPLPPQTLRILRALDLLEWIGTEPAEQLLRDLAGGVRGAHLTEEARLSLERLGAVKK